MSVPRATVYAGFANEAEAARIGRAMIEARLAACVNILAPCRSIYRWLDAVEDAPEVPALFKTTLAGADALVTAIVAAHGYDVPAVTVWPIAATTAAHASWIEAEIGGHIVAVS